jgi:hypothetical protein
MQERILKIVLGLVGLLFLACIYPLIQLRHEEVLQMMLSIYVTLGVFLLLAVRNPSAHRSLIAFAGWSSLAHAAVMAVQSIHDVSDRGHLLSGVVIFCLIGVPLILLTPARQSEERVSAARA